MVGFKIIGHFRLKEVSHYKKKRWRMRFFSNHNASMFCSKIAWDLYVSIMTIMCGIGISPDKLCRSDTSTNCEVDVCAIVYQNHLCKRDCPLGHSPDNHSG